MRVRAAAAAAHLVAGRDELLQLLAPLRARAARQLGRGTSARRARAARTCFRASTRLWRAFCSSWCSATCARAARQPGSGAGERSRRAFRRCFLRLWKPVRKSLRPHARRVTPARRSGGAAPRTCALARQTPPRCSCRAARASGCGAPQPPPARAHAALSTQVRRARAEARTRSSAGRASMRLAACVRERAAESATTCARRRAGCL